MKLSATISLMAACVAFLVSVTGCIPIRRGDKTYYVVVGAAVIRVSQTNQVTVVKSTTIGVYAGDGRINVGASSIYAATVPTNANVVLEVTK